MSREAIGVIRTAKLARMLFGMEHNQRSGPVQARRLQAQQRQVLRERDLELLAAGQWRLTGDPCDCGRNHRAIESRSALGVQRHCPCTFWARQALYQGERFIRATPFHVMVRPYIRLEIERSDL